MSFCDRLHLYLDLAMSSSRDAWDSQSTPSRYVACKLFWRHSYLYL